ncbi:MAG: replication-associated recombination protein A [Ruminococcaceae bacterium]|nr:replication-associated recombination protein A [Oscillospiraceae bacterium]
MTNQPLADRMRPKNFDEIAGQSHLVGKNGIIRKLTENGRIPNMIFFGPPGIGKTTVANIIASLSNMQLYKLNATTASISDIKEVIQSTDNMFAENGTLLYLDEIQYFNKKQQQSLLEFMENGKITLIASTTENPYYCVYNALLSRSSVFEFKSVSASDCIPSLKRAVEILNSDFSDSKTASDTTLKMIASICGGDVRMSIGILENAFYISDKEITEETVRILAPSVVGHFDRDGDVHYNLLSCLQKSIRGSDPDAAVFYLARILASGDILSACRRLLVIANEDIGAAYPLASVITYSCVESAKAIGLPEAVIPLANATCILATAPKSNSTYMAYHLAKEDMDKGLGTTIPDHLKSPDFKGYIYPHDYENNYVKQDYLPYDLIGKKYYSFGSNKTEQAAKAYYEMIRSAQQKRK